MKISFSDIEHNKQLQEQSMSEISGGYKPNPEGPYPTGPSPFPWPYHNDLLKSDKLTPRFEKVSLAGMKAKLKRPGRVRRYR